CSWLLRPVHVGRLGGSEVVPCRQRERLLLVFECQKGYRLTLGVLVPAQSPVGLGKNEADDCAVRGEFFRLLKLANTLFRLTGVEKGRSQGIVGSGILRLKGQGTLRHQCRFVRLEVFIVSDGQFSHCRRARWRDLELLLILLFRGGKLLLKP